MDDLFLCNLCKEKLESFEDKLICKICKNEIKCLDNFIDYPETKDFNFNDFPKPKLEKLIKKIEKVGYTKAVTDFLRDYPIFTKHITDNKSADFIFHCLKKKNVRCLEIGSGFGKNIEILSKIFQKVYSIEWNTHKIFFQKSRFKENGILNVKIIRTDLLKLPFPDNYFDLVICNGLFELIGNWKEKPSLVAQKKFLLELKRIIKEDGCFSLGVENGSSFGSLAGKDIPFKKFEKYKVKHTFQEYQKMLSELGLKNNAYWTLPSLFRPYFSGKVEDKKTTKWFYDNYQRFMLKEKQDKIKNIVLSSFGKMNNLTSNIMAKRFVPNFIFCCHKSNEFTSYEKHLLKSSDYSNFLLLGRKSRLIYILFNKKGIPKKLISLDRFGLNFPEKIENFKRKIPNMKDPSTRVWIEDWIQGTEIDPTNIEHLSKAILWLIKFQKQSQTDELSKTEKSKEVLWFKKRISNFPEINKKLYLKWLDDYEEFLHRNKIYKVARHGDFWYTNILFDKKTNQTNVIDWENFSREGNPFYDFLTFILHVMTLPPKDPVIVFKESLEFKGIFGKIMEKMKNVIDEYFGFKFNLIILLRFFIIRNIIRSNIKGKKLENHMRMLEMLSVEKYLGKLME